MSDDLRLRERVTVTHGRNAKYGMVIGESKDKTRWIVLIDGNRWPAAVAKERVERLKPHQLAFHWGKA